MADAKVPVQVDERDQAAAREIVARSSDPEAEVEKRRSGGG